MSSPPPARNVADIIALFRAKAFDGVRHDPYEPTTLSSIISKANQENSTRTFVIGDYLSIFDKYLEFFMNLADIFSIIVLSKGKKARKKWVTYFTLFGSIVTQMLAIRRLVLDGLDFPAKQVLRCLVEHIDLAVCMSLDGRMSAEFLRYKNLSGQNGAKAFWAKYVRKTKNSHLRKYAYARVESALGKNYINEWKKYRLKEEEILNACIHPSIIACGMNATGISYVTEPDYEPAVLAYYGVIDDAANRTIAYAVISALDYAIYGYLPIWKDIPLASKKDARSADFLKGACKYIKCERVVVLGLADYLIENINNERVHSNKNLHGVTRMAG